MLINNKLLESFLLLILLNLQCVFTQSNTYKAAVLEYAPKLSAITPAENVLQNAKEYVNYMMNAKHQGVEILVFPEAGLTGMGVDVNSLDQVSTEVPDPSKHISPCTDQTHGNYSRFFIDLSCAVRSQKIYAVINLVEWRHKENSGKKIYHNTNVAFDRNGVVIARYRKINLYEEPGIESGDKSQIVTFETDFGVKFGMFICFDMVFNYPALNILSDTSVTDIVYPTGWFSLLPFFQSLSVQHGYAKSNGVNLLAADLNDPASTNGGSGIYLHNGRIVNTYISGYKSSRLVIAQVPKIKSRKDLSNICQASSDYPRPAYGSQQSDVTFFRTKPFDLSLYTVKSVDLKEKEISETVCSKESNFCCHFNITIEKTRDVTPNYAYKLVSFYGVAQVSIDKKIGMRNCGLIACINESIDSCGERQADPPVGVTFRSISVKGNFNLNKASQQPSTLNFDLTPSTDYMYCSKTTEEEVQISLSTTKPHNALLTFGIFGRAHNHDGKPTGLISGASTNVAHVFLVFCISIFVFLQQE